MGAGLRGINRPSRCLAKVGYLKQSTRQSATPIGQTNGESSGTKEGVQVVSGINASVAVGSMVKFFFNEAALDEITQDAGGDEERAWEGFFHVKDWRDVFVVGRPTTANEGNEVGVFLFSAQRRCFIRRKKQLQK